MKTISFSVIFLFCIHSGNAQINKLDTVYTDSTHMEKIKKMPMDTIHHNIPIKPVLPEEQKDKRRDQPIMTPSGKKSGKKS